MITIEPFGTLSRRQREEVVEEATRMLSVLSTAPSYDIRFGTVVRG